MFPIRPQSHQHRLPHSAGLLLLPLWQGERESDTNPFRYAGEYLDKETGDIHLRARYYDPSIGRFISEDPIKDGTNWYVYCSNNPIAFVDPSGLLFQEVIDAISDMISAQQRMAEVDDANHIQMYANAQEKYRNAREIVSSSDVYTQNYWDLTAYLEPIVENNIASYEDLIAAKNAVMSISQAAENSSIYSIYYQTAVPLSQQEMRDNNFIRLGMLVCATTPQGAEVLKSKEAQFMNEMSSMAVMSGVKFDTKQVKAVEKALKMTPAQKELFQREIEMLKHYAGKPNNVNSTYKDLREIGKTIIEFFNK